MRSFLASASTGSLLEKASIFTVFFKKQVYLPSKDLDCPRVPRWIPLATPEKSKDTQNYEFYHFKKMVGISDSGGTMVRAALFICDAHFLFSASVSEPLLE